MVVPEPSEPLTDFRPGNGYRGRCGRGYTFPVDIDQNSNSSETTNKIRPSIADEWKWNALIRKQCRCDAQVDHSLIDEETDNPDA